MRALTSTRNAWAREPAASARSRRSTSIAAVASETTMPSPSQVGHFLVRISRGPSVTFWRVISTRPSGEISTTYVFVRSRSSSLRSASSTWRPVLRVRHVDEVDDDDPADVAQPELADDLLDRLEVVLRDRVLEPRAGALRARADEAAGVDVDDGERLGVVEDQVAARREVDAARERRADLRVDAGALEERRLLLVAVDPLDHVRRGLLQVADDALEGALVVDLGALEVAREEIADDPQRQLGLLVDERRRLGGLRLRLDRLPEPLQEDEVALDVLGGRALGGRADDDPALLDVEALDDLLQPRALVVVEPARDAEALALRDEDDEAAGERDLGREPRALRLHRVLDGLDEDLLAARDQVGDLLAVALALELGDDDLVDVEEAVLLEPDLDERGLHPGQDVVDGAEVDVAGDRALAPAARGRPRRRGRPRGPRRAARRRRPRSGARASPSAAAPASAARGGGSPCWLARRSWRWLRSPDWLRWPRSACGLRSRARLLGLLRPLSASACSPSVAEPGFLRPRPPRLPRRRFGAVSRLPGARCSGVAVGGGRGRIDGYRLRRCLLYRSRRGFGCLLLVLLALPSKPG